ncbi:MAG: GNAT family N-acetyltransferase [Flavobacteriaceae bacterium]|nr:GNAT family N-acetyltransferase [Flavobacteriaceae bacterium]
MIQIKELYTPKELKTFVEFPFSLYKNNKYWVPPIIKDEVASFDPTENPVFKHAEARYFIALKDGEIVGRVAAIVNWVEVRDQKIKKMRFGWLDMIDDIEVTKALLNEVRIIGQSHQLTFMEGPVGFSNLDKVGVLTEGFDHLGTMITWYNHAYYKDHFEQLGFTKGKVFLENKMDFSNIQPKYFERISTLVEKRYGLRALNFKKTADVMPYVNEMFDLFNESYASLASFVPISDIQKEYFKKKYISFINPEYIQFVMDKEGKMVAFGITMPSFSTALQKANGKLFPFGIFHLLRAKKKSKEIIFYLIGIHPDYQNKGVTSILFREYHKAFEKNGIETCIRTPELEENTAIHQLWKNFKPVTHKKRCTYLKNI